MDWLRPRNFSRTEQAWIATFFFGAAFLSTFPYLIFAASTPPHNLYTWASVFYYDDTFQYYAWARHIAQGDFLIRNYYTSNPEASYALFNPYFLALGWLTRIANNVYLASHALRIVGIAPFSWISYSFISLFLKEPRLRRAAQLLILGGGLEYPYVLLAGSRDPTPLADPYIFKVLYRDGHLITALCFLLFIFGSYVSSIERDASPKPRIIGSSIALFLATLTLGLINPYYVVLACAVLGLHAGWMLIRHRASQPLILVSSALLGGFVAYLEYRIQSLSSNLGAISFDDPIGPLDFALFFAILLPLAVAGWWGMRKEGSKIDPHLAFLLLWVVGVAVLVVTPLPFRARMVFGLGAALAIPVAWLLGRESFTGLAYWPLYALLALEAGYTFYLEAVKFREQGVGQIDRGMIAAMRTIDERAISNNLVLCLADTGNIIPAYTRATVYVGHSFQTERYYEKQEEVRRFFGAMDEGERRTFLKKSGAWFVFIGPNEREINPKFDLPAWRKIFDQSGYTVYEKTEAGVRLIPDEAQVLVIDKGRVIAIAEQAVGGKELNVTAVNHLPGGGWSIFIEFIPARPGGHCTVELSSSGEIIRIVPGA